MKPIVGALLALAFSARASGTIQYFHWDKPHHGNRGNVVLSEVLAGKSVNFVHETATGVLTGNDEGEVVLLDKASGKVVWRCRLENKGEIEDLVAETDEGFFVSSGDSLFWLVSRDGKLLLRCYDTCTIPK